jgi:hypothetical protein
MSLVVHACKTPYYMGANEEQSHNLKRFSNKPVTIALFVDIHFNNKI